MPQPSILSWLPLVVLLVEDHEVQREALAWQLEQRGFTVHAVGTVAEAEAILAQDGLRLDVAVLDMRLQDPKAPTVTGAELAKRIKALFPHNPPEFLFHSAFDDIDYYQAALQVGAAAYVQKGKEDNDLMEVVRLVCVLGLRRAIAYDDDSRRRILEQIVNESMSPVAALESFCKQVMAALAGHFLRLPFLLLLSEGEETRACGGTLGLRDPDPELLRLLQVLAHGPGRALGGFRVDANALRSVLSVSSPSHSALRDAIIVPIPLERPYNLSILLGAREADERMEKAEPMARLLQQHLQPSVVDRLVGLLKLLSRQNERSRSQAKETAEVCLNISRQDEDIFNGLIEETPEVAGSPQLLRLVQRASRLKNLGEQLEGILSASPRSRWTRFDVAEVIRSAWQSVYRPPWRGPLSELQATACVAYGNREYVEEAARNVLQFMVERCDELGADIGTIRVHCRASLDATDILFIDHAPILPPQARRRLLEPFHTTIRTQHSNGPTVDDPCALYLSRVLVEQGSGGRVMDGRALAGKVEKGARTAKEGSVEEDATEEIGNCYQFRLPSPPVADANA